MSGYIRFLIRFSTCTLMRNTHTTQNEEWFWRGKNRSIEARETILAFEKLKNGKNCLLDSVTH